MGFFGKLFGSADPASEKVAKFREIDSHAFGQDPETVAYMKATWLTSRGNEYGTNGQFKEAIQDFREAISLKPDHLMAYFGLALALHKSGQEDEAARTLNSAPDEMKAHGEVLLRKADLLKAAESQDTSFLKKGEI
jgi:tetratricopeptide (TPR) repeat protein